MTCHASFGHMQLTFSYEDPTKSLVPGQEHSRDLSAPSSLGPFEL